MEEEPVSKNSIEIRERIVLPLLVIQQYALQKIERNSDLKEIYEKIDKLEKTKIEITSYRNAKELYLSWMSIGFVILLLELFLSKTLFRKLP